MMGTGKQGLVLGILSSVFGLLAGIGIKLAVPYMKQGMDTQTLLAVSWLSPLLFLPALVGCHQTKKAWAAFPTQAVVGLFAGFASGYFVDSLLSCLLAGLMAALAYWVAALTTKIPAGQLYISAMVIGMVSTGLNVWGHRLADHSFSFFAMLFAGTIAVFIAIAYCVLRASKWLENH